MVSFRDVYSAENSIRPNLGMFRLYRSKESFYVIEGHRLIPSFKFKVILLHKMVMTSVIWDRKFQFKVNHLNNGFTSQGKCYENSTISFD